MYLIGQHVQFLQLLAHWLPRGLRKTKSQRWLSPLRASSQLFCWSFSPLKLPDRRVIAACVQMFFTDFVSDLLLWNKSDVHGYRLSISSRVMLNNIALSLVEALHLLYGEMQYVAIRMESDKRCTCVLCVLIINVPWLERFDVRLCTVSKYTVVAYKRANDRRWCTVVTATTYVCSLPVCIWQITTLCFSALHVQ